MTALPSAMKELARFFLNLSGSSSLGASGDSAGVTASAAALGGLACPSSSAAGAAAFCGVAATPAGAGVLPDASAAVPSVSGEQQHWVRSRSRGRRSRSSDDRTDRRAKKRSRRRSPSLERSSRRREKRYCSSSDSSEDERAAASSPRDRRAHGGARAGGSSWDYGRPRSYARVDPDQSGARRRSPGPSGVADDDRSSTFESVDFARDDSFRTCEERFLAQKTLFLLALASAKHIGELHALSYRVSHTRDWGEVSFAFVTGFVAKTQDPSSLAPRFEGFSVPALTNARKNRNGRLLCPVRAVKVYLDRTAPHRPRCERLFVTAGRSKKEISKTTVSFWLRKTISRAYELSGTALPVPAPRARETRGIAPSILFRKNFAVDQVLKAGTWRRHTTFTRHYLRDIAHKSLDTFHLGPVVAAQSVV